MCSGWAKRCADSGEPARLGLGHAQLRRRLPQLDFTEDVRDAFDDLAAGLDLRRVVAGAFPKNRDADLDLRDSLATA